MMTPSRPSDRRVQTVCLLTLTLIAVGVTMYLLQPVLVPFVLALFLSQCLAPLILVLMRRGRMPRLLAVTVAVLLAAGVLTGIGFLVAESVSNGQAQGKFDTYQDSWNRLIDRVARSKMARLLGASAGGHADGTGGGAAIGQQLTPYLQSWSLQALTQVRNSASVLLLMAFLLYGRRWDMDRPTTAVRTRAGRGHLLSEIEQRVQQYISVTALMGLLTGLLVGASLAVFHVQFAAVWGLLALLLTFIPNFGGVIATLLPLPVIVLDPNLAVWMKVCALAVPAGWQVLIGSLLQPRMTGQSLDLHPVVILLSLLFFSMIWNVAGAFLAVPLTATFKIVFEKIPNFRPLAAALAGNLDPLTDTLDAPAVEEVAVVEIEQKATTETRRHGEEVGR